MERDMTTSEGRFDLSHTYVHLADGGAGELIEVTESLWPEVMTGQRQYPGRLVTVRHMAEDWPTWELHPQGEELLFMLWGTMELVLEKTGGEQIVELREGQSFLVPRGVWHTANVRRPSKLLAVTVGEGTQIHPR
jgi:mannose-6-phosphate isomerase-like protein (cupin superfamily)